MICNNDLIKPENLEACQVRLRVFSEDNTTKPKPAAALNACTLGVLDYESSMPSEHVSNSHFRQRLTVLFLCVDNAVLSVSE
jgi:hypothetical protein